MTIDEILAEGRAAIAKRDRETPLSPAAARAVALDLRIKFGSTFEAHEEDDRDRIEFGQDEDPLKNQPDETR